MLRSSRAQASRPSTTLATTARSHHTLRLTTSTIRNALASPLYIQERQANASLRQTCHSNEESVFPSAQSILASTERPAQKRMSSQSRMTMKSGTFWKDRRNDCSQKQNQKSWNTRIERILPKTTFVHQTDKLSLKQWKLGILWQGMNSPDENKVYFTKNWQNENEHFVTLVLGVFTRWKNWRELMSYESMSFRERGWSKTKTLTMCSWAIYKNCKMRSILWMIQENLKMPNQHAVDTYPAFPVNHRYFLFLLNDMSLEPRQALNLLHQVFLKTLVMKTVSTAMNIVHKVETPKGLCSTQISTFWQMMSIGRWHLRHTNMQQQLDHFAFQWLKMEINKTYAIWSPCRVYNDHCTSMERPTTSTTWKLKFQKKFTV